eukprot:CAMPEP_0202346014 /NCGR_PEP_ID=MMETSP1126-20121109/4990_1 /ASSEMBLY_ACC=CAM_ASM_000457 /TAXON_ID=3047 /ORGANISM="Dunaliella tertiolecta, Strain CCMP1320" /LENGTH=135 /DNA_ID=CAMNT_0048937369 /DNA_START=304 /DNA_END=711 /DNA_ORIENTATION=+
MKAGRMCWSCACGCRTTSSADMDSIWHAVFHLPNELTLTALCAPPPDAAAHSLSEDIVISRHMMMATGSTTFLGTRGAGGLVVSRIRAVVTMILSATGSRNAPNTVEMPSLLARYPSSQSVQAATMKMAAHMMGL